MTAPAFWPDALQRPLLRAAFLGGDAARAAWEHWRARVPLDDHPDPGSFRLLPQVCRNVRRLGIDDPVLEKLSGVARQSWFKNQRAIADLVPYVRALHAAGVEVLPLGSVAMMLRRPDYACERTPEWSLLVRPDHAPAALRQLYASGWRTATRPPDPLLDAYVAFRSGETFHGPDGRRLDLVWQWLPGHADDDVWRAAEPVRLHDVPVRRFDPVDHLLYVGAQRRPPVARPEFWGAVDVMLIVDAVNGRVEWTRLVREVGRRGLAPWLGDTLRHLDDALDAPFPAEIVRRVAAEHGVPPVAALPPHATIPQEIARLWARYCAFGGDLGLVRRLVYFPRYLQYLWRLESLRDVPRRALASTRYLLR